MKKAIDKLVAKYPSTAFSIDDIALVAMELTTPEDGKSDDDGLIPFSDDDNDSASLVITIEDEQIMNA